MRRALVIAALFLGCAPGPSLPGGVWVTPGPLPDGGSQYVAWRFSNDGGVERFESGGRWPYRFVEQTDWSWKGQLIVGGVRWPVIDHSEAHLQLAAPDGGRQWVIRSPRCPQPLNSGSAWSRATFETPPAETIETIASHADEQGIAIARRTQLIEARGDECELEVRVIELPGVPQVISRLPDAGFVAICQQSSAGPFFGVHLGPPMTVTKLDTVSAPNARQLRFQSLALRASVIAAWESLPTDVAQREIFVALPAGDGFEVRAIAPPDLEGSIGGWTLLRDAPSRERAWLAVLERVTANALRTRFFPVDGDRRERWMREGSWASPALLEPDGGVTPIGLVARPVQPGGHLLLRTWPLLRGDGSTVTFPSSSSAGVAITEFPGDAGPSAATLLPKTLAPPSGAMTLFESKDGRVHLVGLGVWLIRDANAAPGAR